MFDEASVVEEEQRPFELSNVKDILSKPHNERTLQDIHFLQKFAYFKDNKFFQQL